MDINIKLVNKRCDKINIMQLCDAALPIKLFERANYTEIVEKIVENAFFLGAFNWDGLYKFPIGYVAFYANNHISKNAFISSICVLNEYQRSHIGSKLMRRCIEISKKQGMERLRLEVLKTNDKAIDFYSSWGFEYEEERENSFYMRKCNL